MKKIIIFILLTRRISRENRKVTLLEISSFRYNELLILREE